MPSKIRVILLLSIILLSTSASAAYTNWASGEPNDQNGEDCVHMRDDGTWNDNTCGDDRIGICEYDDGSYDTTSAMSWSDVDLECESRGGNLLVVEDSQENNYISNNYNDAWIGYRQQSGASEPSGGWEWVNPIVGIEVCHHDHSAGRWECGSGNGDPGDEDKYTSNGWSAWSGFSQSNDDVDGYQVRVYNEGLKQIGVQGKHVPDSGTEYTGQERYTSSGWSGFSSETRGSSSRGGGTRVYMDGACTVAVQWCKYDKSRGDWECYSQESTGNGWSSWSQDIQPVNDVSGLRSRIKIDSCYSNQAPSVDSVSFSDSASDHSFTVESVVSDPDGEGDINSCEIRAQGSSNTETFNGFDGNYGNGNEALCSTTIDYSSFSSHLENLDITVTVSDSAGQSDSRVRSHSFPNHDPVKNDFYFVNSSIDHEFTVYGEATDTDNGNNEINNCQISWTDEQGNTGTIGSTITGSNPRVCSGTIEDGGDIEVGENIAIDLEMSDQHSSSVSWSGSNTLINHKPTVIDDPNQPDGDKDLKFVNYTDEHAFNVTSYGRDTDSGSNEIVSCRFELSDQDGNNVDVTGDLDTVWGNEDEAKCFYSNVNASMPRDGSGDPIEPGFETLEKIDVTAVFVDSHMSEGSLVDSNLIPNSPALIRNEEPRNETLWLDDKAELNVSVRDDQDSELKVYFHNARNDNLLGKDVVTNAVSSYQKAYSEHIWSDLDLGKTYKWKVNVSDGIANRTRYYEFLRASTQQYRTEQRIEYRYSSIITTQENQKQFFIEIENNIDETKSLKTYLTGVNGVIEQYDSSITPVYTLDPYETKEFSIIVRPNSNGNRKLNITTENIGAGVNTTESFPVLVRDLPSVGNSREVDGITITQIVVIMLVSGLLYSVRL